MREIIKKVATRLGLPEQVVEKTYKAYWLFIRTTIGNLPLKEDLKEEEFNKLRTNFNLPSLGKLSCNYDRWLRIINLNNIKKESKYDDYKKGKASI